MKPGEKKKKKAFDCAITINRNIYISVSTLGKTLTRYGFCGLDAELSFIILSIRSESPGDY